MKLTPEAAQALTNLRGNRDFEVVLKWLKEYELKETDTCVSAEGATLHRAQGAVKALREIPAALKDAPDTLKKILNQPTGNTR